MKEDGRIIAFSAGMLVLRLVLGVILFARGGLVLFDWWTTQEGLAASPYATYIGTQGLDFVVSPIIWTWIIGLVQFVGGILLVFGLMTRITALLNAIITVLLMSVVEWTGAFFLVLYGQTGVGTADYQGGIEYLMLLAGVCFVLFLTGAGKYSIDAAFAPKKKKEPKPPRKKKEEKPAAS
jgi:putative oxidoreductase